MRTPRRLFGYRNASLAAGGSKAGAVARITIRQQMAYKTDFIMRASFLLMILYVFVQLWSAAYDGDHARIINGYTLKQIIWYLVFTEAITMGVPALCGIIENEVKSGDIAVRLIRPLSYVGYHYAAYLAEAVFRFFVHLAVGSAIAWLCVGPPTFGMGWAGLFSLTFGAITVAFVLNMIVALCAFWVEETRGMEFVLHKLQFTVGGMLLPLDLMPEPLRRICVWLPFQAMLYFPARTAVNIDAAPIAEQFAIQAVWILLLGALVMWMYKRGVSRLHVNGG
ncbi:ABC transporter permease [Paenibacillus sacheonensis]|uniref:ABC transporter permease n=1 Tax=Paenibacillus sacheonensis TaxID=742054 RepID=A0A7X5C118_9BACL|nr:ABC-2 family transporter protein [Paenibacillus sacheonensis]MBM7565746.1 ABC-2 type transport system permease protein [Paenibacillus sacheonensis]NBC72196.1 ABC transporter permease [Paenibacillus sacheonensis]